MTPGTVGTAVLTAGARRFPDEPVDVHAPVGERVAQGAVVQRDVAALVVDGRAAEVARQAANRHARRARTAPCGEHPDHSPRASLQHLDRRVVRAQRAIACGGSRRERGVDGARRADLPDDAAQHPVPERPVPARAPVGRAPAIAAVASVERERARAVDDRVVDHEALLRPRRQDVGPTCVGAAVGADLQRGPDRAARRDRAEQARPCADACEGRVRLRERDGEDVDAVHVGHARVRPQSGGRRGRCLDRQPGVCGIEGSRTTAPPACAAAGHPAERVPQERGLPLVPAGLVGALPERERRICAERGDDPCEHPVGRAPRL